MLEKIKEEKSKIISAIILISAGVILRLLLQNVMMDIFFVIAVISILSGLLLGSYYTFVVPISIMIITDLMLGNNMIFLFTWTGFILLALVGYFVRPKTGLSLKKAPLILGSGIVGILLYDLWTNFGCWLGWYPKTIGGLATCYTVAIPFTIWHLVSTTIALTAVVIPLALLNKDCDLNLKSMDINVTAGLTISFIFAAILSVLV